LWWRAVSVADIVAAVDVGINNYILKSDGFMFGSVVNKGLFGGNE
jgi:hypothetical protein